MSETVVDNGDERNAYRKMGVKPVINAIGGVTLLGASSLSPRVMAAVRQANGEYVVMHELLDRAGEIIAETLGSEAACLTSGMSSGLVMSTAACMCGQDQENISRIPDTSGMKNEVLIQRPERWLFERTVTQTGAKLVKVGDEMRCTPEEIEAAIGPSTAAIVWVASSRARPGAEMVPLEEVVRIGRERSVPVIVDAAGQSDPLSKFRRYAQSADLVCFGAKYIGGPNSVGYVCGGKELIKAVDLQGFVSFDELGQQGLHGGIGRAFKIDRSEAVAAVVSLEEWFEIDHEARLRESEKQLEVVEDELRQVPGIAVSRTGGRDTGIVALQVAVDESAGGKTARDVAIELAQGDPPVWVGWGHRFPERLSVVASWGTLMKGQEQVLAQRLREALTSNVRPSTESVSGHHPAMNVPVAPPEQRI